MKSSPLRSGTNCSDRRFLRDVQRDTAGIKDHIDAGGVVHLLSGQTGLLVRARYPASEGPIDHGPHLRIGLNIGNDTRLVHHAGGVRLEGVWRRGTMTIMPPESAGFSVCGAVTMIGLAILPDASPMAPSIELNRLRGMAAQFCQDPLLASVLMALHHEADTHGTSTAFFDHGIALTLKRLTELSEIPITGRPRQPLSQARYDRLAEYVENRLGEDLPVTAMASIVGMDPSGFTRALRARTGFTPYAWLTRQRMDYAVRRLSSGLPVTQVAGEVGYANASKFAAAFRRVHGMLPSRSVDER